MSSSNTLTAKARPTTPTGLWPVLLGAGLFAAILAVDFAGAGRSVASEEEPILSGPYALRSLILLMASTAMVVGLRQLATRLPRRSDETFVVEPSTAAISGSLIALTAALLVLVEPSILSELAREDRLVEWSSAVLAFAAAGLYWLAALRRGFDASGLALAAVGGGCLLLGLEEISWFQRVLDVDSPEFMLNRNGQQELNLHNLATGLTGNLYYLGAFGWCVLVPALLGDRQFGGRWRWLNPLVPSWPVLVGSATAAGVVYEMWNIAWIQVTFWMSLVALIIVGRGTERGPVGVLVAVVTVATAAAFLIEGDAMVRSWDDTEIRELIIPYGLTVAGLEAARRAKQPTLEPG